MSGSSPDAPRGRASVPGAFPTQSPTATGRARPVSPAAQPATAVGRAAAGPTAAGPMAAGPMAAGPGAGAAPPGRRHVRGALLAVSAVLAVLTVAAVTVVTRPGPVAGWLADDPRPSAGPSAEPAEPPPPPVLAAAGAAGTAPTVSGVRAAIGALLSAPSLGSRVNISVVDAADGETLYAANEDTLTIPASTTKLVTAATVLDARGPAYRLTTRVVAGAQPGEVVIIGGGDPTLSATANDLFPGAARLDLLAAKVKKALGGVRPTRVVVDGSLFTGPTLGPRWDSDIVSSGQGARITALTVHGGRVRPVHHERGGDERFINPSRGAGQVFARALGLPTSAVTEGRAPVAPPGAVGATGAGAPSAGAPGDAPGSPATTPGVELGRVDSPPLIRIVDWMLQISDNVLAEALARQVALAAGRPASFAGGAEAMKAAVAELGLPAAESDVVDGSGLSRDNKITPSLLTDLLALAAGGTRPALTGIVDGLPVAGWSGTLADRFDAPRGNRVGQGLVRGKTGTLYGISTISGQLVTAGGRLLVFAILADAVPDTQNPDSARSALDRILAKLVTCGCS